MDTDQKHSTPRFPMVRIRSLASLPVQLEATSESGPHDLCPSVSLCGCMELLRPGAGGLFGNLFENLLRRRARIFRCANRAANHQPVRAQTQRFPSAERSLLVIGRSGLGANPGYDRSEERR